jgi:hypothetical protein
MEWPFPIGFGYKLVYIARDQMVWSLHTTSRIKWWCLTLKCQSTKIDQIPNCVVKPSKLDLAHLTLATSTPSQLSHS